MDDQPAPATREPGGLDPRELDEAVQDLYPALSSTQRRVVDRLLADTALAVSSARTVAKELGVSPSVLTRTAQALGFDGYPELQAQLQERLTRPELPTAERLERVTERYGSGSPEHIAVQVLADDLASLTQTIDDLDPTELSRAVSILGSATRVMVFGARASAGLASWLVVNLRSSVREIVLLDQSRADLPDQIAEVRPGDVVFVICFRRVDRVSAAVAEHASRRGARVISLGDHPATPVTAHAELSLVVARPTARLEPPFTAALAVLTALTTTAAVVNRSLAASRLESLETLWADFRLFAEE